MARNPIPITKKGKFYIVGGAGFPKFVTTSKASAMKARALRIRFLKFREKTRKEALRLAKAAAKIKGGTRVPTKRRKKGK